MTRKGAASIVASPVLVGAVTVLITLVAVFLAYNANNGLPFVPTYDLYAQLPSGENLVKGNEVRIGGFRIGVVDKIQPMLYKPQGKAIAKIHMKLDKKVEPLAKDTTVFVRSRSALGLKYVQITPGKSSQTYKAGDTIPLKFATAPVELDELFNAFDAKTRNGQRLGLKGFGDAFAGRGESINVAIQALNPFMVHLTPVMQNLSAPDTQLKEFFKQIGRASAQVAPVARVQAELFANMADTFHAFDHNPRALQASIEKAPPTLQTSIDSFRVQRPFLADFADLSHRLRPVAAELPTTLPRINTAFKAGIPVLPRTVGLNRQTKQVFQALDDLVKNPNVLLGLRDLTTTLTVLTPFIQYVNPYESVCNYGTYFFTGLGGHMSEDVHGGTIERVLVRSDSSSPPVPGEQPNTLNTTDSYRPADVPANEDSRTAKDTNGQPLTALHGQPYQSAIDAAGHADCQTGQFGYLEGPLPPPPTGRYPPATAPGSGPGQRQDFWQNKSGGSHVVGAPDTPGLAGPTYTGVPSLKKVP